MTLSVLLVEDDPGDARLLQQAMAADGAVPGRIEHVTTLADAVARVLRAPGPDVVLLDLTLPDSGGLHTVDQFLERAGSLPVVVLTGTDDDYLARRAVEAGAQDYVVKGSVTGDVLRRVLQHAIERHRLQSALRERMKEMAGLYAISQELQRDLSPNEVCQRAAGHLVHAMQWPEVCGAEVVIGEVRGEAGVPPTDLQARLSSPIAVGGRVRGMIVVGYDDAREFLLPEEQRMLDAAARDIGGWLERADALDRLLLEEQRLRILVEHLPGMVWTTDRDLCATFYSGGLLDDVGITDDRYLGTRIVELFESDLESGIAPFRAALSGESSVFERFWHGRWIRNYVEPKRNSSGEVVGVVCLSLDITTERAQQTELEAAHLRFRGLFDNASDAMILADDQGVYVDVNPAATELTGYPRDELIGMRARDLAPEGSGIDPAEADAMWERFLAEGEMGGDFPIERRGGGIVHTEFRAVANIAGGVHLSIIRDVTARKRAEAALAASEARFRAMAEAAQDAIYRLRVVPEPRFEYVNPAVEALTGYPPEAFLDDPELGVGRVHPDDRHVFDVSRIGAGGSQAGKARFQRADGTWIWIEDRRTLVVEDDEIVGVQGVIRDVTAREQADQALREALEVERRAIERLRAADRMKSNFLRAVSHELRTPLTSVLGYARTLDAHHDRLDAEQTRDFHGRLVRNAERLDALLTDLLDVERLGRGEVEVDQQPYDVNNLAREVAETFDFGGRRVVLDDAPAVAPIDVPKVGRVLHHLLSNAIKHTPPTTTIWVTGRADETGATIEVADDGPGIPQDDRPRVFEPFWQGANMTESPSPGTGIGLALVRQYAALHGGTATVRPRSEGGTIFSVWLPAEDRSARSSASPAEEAGPRSPVDQLLGRMRLGDSLAVLLLGDSATPPNGAIMHLAELARQHSRKDDHVLVSGPDEVVLLLPNLGVDRAAKVLRRLQAAWGQDPAVTAGLGTGLATVEQMPATADMLDTARRRARELPGIRGGSAGR